MAETLQLILAMFSDKTRRKHARIHAKHFLNVYSMFAATTCRKYDFFARNVLTKNMTEKILDLSRSESRHQLRHESQAESRADIARDLGATEKYNNLNITIICL